MLMLVNTIILLKFVVDDLIRLFIEDDIFITLVATSK